MIQNTLTSIQKNMNFFPLSFPYISFVAITRWNTIILAIYLALHLSTAHMFLLPTGAQTQFRAPTCFGYLLQPSSGSYNITKTQAVYHMSVNVKHIYQHYIICTVHFSNELFIYSNKFSTLFQCFLVPTYVSALPVPSSGVSSRVMIMNSRRHP